jgi:hypothetical protein
MACQDTERVQLTQSIHQIAVISKHVPFQDGEPSDIAAQRAERKASNTRSKGGKRQLESKDEQAGAKEARLEAAAGEGQQAQ